MIGTVLTIAILGYFINSCANDMIEYASCKI